MKELFSIDLHDYDEDCAVSSRPSVRGIIITNGRIALVYSKKEKYYKFPGGGIEVNEDMKEALVREVREETGLTVIAESIAEFGSVLRRQMSNYLPNTVFEQQNYYFFCETEDRVVSQELDDYEKDAGFVLRIVDIDEAVRANSVYRSSDIFDEIMVKRDLKVMELLREHIRGAGSQKRE